MGVICKDKETERKNNELNELVRNNEEKIQNLKTALDIAIKRNPSIIEEIENIELGIDFSTYRRNIAQLIRESREEMDAIKFYDVIVSIQSIKDIIKGWNIKLSKRFENDHENLVNNQVITIGIIGNSNKGKSFILSKLSKMTLPSGTSIKTEGLSIKYPVLDKYKNRKIVLLDSAGLETPVLKENNEHAEKEDKEKEENTDNKPKQTKIEKVEKVIKQSEIKNEKDNIHKGKVEDKKESEKELFKEKSRDKIITEYFLQNYIIHNSDILIAVVGLLTYSEQKILNRIKTELKRAKIYKTLYIIHNLMTFTSIKQVKSYINDILLKSATFELNEKPKINIKTESDDQNGVCYYEINSNYPIFHLIYANEGSEAGNFYNQYTLTFLENSFEKITDFKGFDILATVKERFKEVSKEFIENLEDEICFDNSKNIIKVLKPERIILKKCLIDELGFSNLKANGFEPYYNYYKNNNQIIVRVEAPGNCDIESSIHYGGEYIVIKLTGIKKKDEEPAKIEDNIFNGRELGKFSLDIPLKTGDFLIKNEKPKIEKKNGIFILAYQIEEINEIGVYKQDNKDNV